MARVFQTATLGEAQIRVAIVSRGLADLLVHRVDSWGAAQGDALWLITRDRHQATALIHTCSMGMAEVNICFVDTYAEAGWVRAHRLQGRFGR